MAIGVLLEQVGLLETTDKGQPICTTDYPSLPPLLFLAGMHLLTRQSCSRSVALEQFAMGKFLHNKDGLQQLIKAAKA